MFYDSVLIFSDSVCQVTAVLREGRQSQGHTICAGIQRIKHVYTSKKNEVEVRILGGQATSAADGKYFLLEYQGKVSRILWTWEELNIQENQDLAYVISNN